MKKAITLFSILLLVMLYLPASAEDAPKAPITIEYYPSDMCGRYAEFVPDEDAQRKLLDLLENANFIDMSHDFSAFPDLAEVSLGITLSYEGYTAYLRTGGWIRRLENDGLGIWFAQNTDIVDTVTELLTGHGYEPIDPAAIKPVVRAELCDGEYYTGQPHEPIVISDPASLKKLEGLITGSTLSEPSGCPFGYAKLIIIDADGTQYELYPATDSCAQYFINGTFFNYDSSVGDEKHDTNQVLFDLFGIVPIEYYHNAK